MTELTDDEIRGIIHFYRQSIINHQGYKGHFDKEVARLEALVAGAKQMRALLDGLEKWCNELMRRGLDTP